MTAAADFRLTERTNALSASVKDIAPARQRGRPPRWLWPAVIAAVAAALRLGLFIAGPTQDLGRSAQPDTSRYVELAESLRTQGVFGLPREDEHPTSPVAPLHRLRVHRGEAPPLIDGLVPEALRTPGYPAFLAVVRAAGLPLSAALVIQCLLSVGAVVLTCLAGTLLFHSRRAGLVAAAILAVHPGDVVGPNLLLTETLFGFLLLLGVVCVLGGMPAAHTFTAEKGKSGAQNEKTIRPCELSFHFSRAAIGGLVLGAATLVRPVGLLVGPALGLWLILTRRDRRGMAAGLLVAGLSLLPPGLWAVRNARAGLGLTVSNVSTVHLAKTAAFMDMRADGANRYPQDYYPRYDAVMARVAAEIRDGETVDAAVRRIVRAKIRSHPWVYSGLLADSAAKFMLDHSAGDLYGLLGWTYRPSGLRDRLLVGKAASASRPDTRAATSVVAASPASQPSSLAVAAVWTAWNVILAGLLAWSLIAMALHRRWPAFLLLAGILAYFILATQYHGQERMRLPVLWVQALAVGYVTSRKAIPDAAERLAIG